MKFVHLSDLHIGKSVCKHSMIEEQRYILKQILEIVENECCDSVLISGDVYDRSQPPAEAVIVFDEFLTALVEKKLSVYIISGNHDSADRLSYGARLFTANDVHIATQVKKSVECVKASDQYGEINIYMLPFMTRFNANSLFANDDDVNVTDENSAMKAVLDHTKIDFSQRNILMAHTFVAGSQICESEDGYALASMEENVSVGTIECVSSRLFENFDYTALGHLHVPQKAGKDNIRYSGSPLKYSVSEIGRDKTVPVVEIKEKGNVEIKYLPLLPLHDMHEIKGGFAEISAAGSYPEISDDYLHIVLTDDDYIPDAATSLAAKYKRILRVDTDRNSKGYTFEEENLADIESKSAYEIFKTLFEQQNGREMSEEQEKIISDILENIDREDN